jgi:isopenicillin-N epimerase
MNSSKQEKQEQQEQEATFRIRFGKEAREKLFALDPSFTFTNHGSFGTCPSMIMEKRFDFQRQIERCADKWFRQITFEQWDKNIRALAEYLRVDERSIVMCENVTEAINAVLKSIEFELGGREAIMATDYTYGAVLHAIDYVSKYRLREVDRVHVFKVPIRYPIESTDSLVDEFDKMCHHICVEKGLRLRVAFVDHISSANALMYPLKQINAVIRKWSRLKCNNETLIIVDGAHSIGHVPLELASYDCDYYASNLHKWLLAPKSCCFLYLKDSERLGKTLQPNYISWGYREGLSLNFCYRATSDKSAFFVVDDCIKFYEQNLGGLERIGAYNRTLLEKATAMLTKEWGTEVLMMPEELEAPFMKCIKVPELKSFKANTEQEEFLVTMTLIRTVMEKYKLVAVFTYIQRELYVRIGCFVYNEFSDYVVLKDAVLDLASQ